MPCYKPLLAYRLGCGSISFSERGDVREQIELPCGRCIGCRLQRSADWATRCVHEAQFHEHNSFLTLTYNDENFPYGGSLSKRDLQLFFKRLRKYTDSLDCKVSYLACGEYGDQLSRPHYHICLFGFSFLPDRKRLGTSKDGQTTYTSKILERIWGKGYVHIGNLNYQSAKYTASYVLKKINGDMAQKHYETTDPRTGEVIQRLPEFLLCSKGLGKDWIQKYYPQVNHRDGIIIDGKKVSVPRYYEKQLKKITPDKLDDNKQQRVIEARARGDSSYERLAVKEKVAIARQNLKNRDYERS